MEFVLVRYKSGIVHAVWAGGDAASGSLYEFLTFCGRRILQISDWTEIEEGELTCKQCRRDRYFRYPQSVGSVRVEVLR